MAVPALSFEENPYCTECLKERIINAAKGTEFMAWKSCGDYLVLTNLAQQKPQ
jgi:hypothetical protein